MRGVWVVVAAAACAGLGACDDASGPSYEQLRSAYRAQHKVEAIDRASRTGNPCFAALEAAMGRYPAFRGADLTRPPEPARTGASRVTCIYRFGGHVGAIEARVSKPPADVVHIVKAAVDGTVLPRAR